MFLTTDSFPHRTGPLIYAKIALFATVGAESAFFFFPLCYYSSCSQAINPTGTSSGLGNGTAGGNVMCLMCLGAKIIKKKGGGLNVKIVSPLLSVWWGKGGACS